MKKYLSILLFFHIGLQAQDYKFGEVSKAELQQTFHPKDSTAPAATLYEKGYLNIYYENGWNYDLEVKKRVKIYNSKGYGYATIKLPYYYGKTSNEREDIRYIKAFVYNLDGKKINDKKIKKRDIIDEELSELWRQVKFTFPNLRPGSIIEFSYTLKSPLIRTLPEWRFQDDIPVNKSIYNIVIPEYFNYKESQKGYYTIQRSTETLMTNLMLRLSDDTYRSTTGNATVKATGYTYQAEEIPKLKNEPFVNNIKNFMTSVKHELSFFKDPINNTLEKYTTTWEKVALELQESNSFGKELDETKYYEEDIDEILSQASSHTEEIAKIFDHVKTHMAWNKNTGIYCTDKLKRSYEDRTGNIADINLMLTSMLRYAGFDAHPVLVSTISHGIPTTTASSDQYNYIIAAIEYPNDEYILLDASNPFTAPNLLPTRCLNWYGQLIRPKGTFKRIDLNPKTASKDNFIMKIKLDANGDITGQMRHHYTKQYAYEYRENISAINQKEFINILQNKLGITIKDYECQNINTPSKPVVETISFEKQKGVNIINDNIYISPLLFLAQDKNPFKQNQKERKLPIDFTFPFSKRYVINIEIPKNYKIDYIPEATAIALPNDKGFYQFNIQETQTGDLQIIVKREINQSILSADFYQSIKDFYKNIFIKETDKIVLSKN